MAVPKLILHEQIQSLGWPGVVGALLLLLSAVYGLAVVQPARSGLLQVQQEVDTATTTVQPIGEAGQFPVQTSEAQRAAFYRDFPAQTEVTRWIERIYAAAAAEKLLLTRGEYLLAPVADTRLTRYQITLPVHGDYARIRRFIATILATTPNLSVDDLNLQRQSISDPQVEGRIRLSLYLVTP